MNGSTTNGARSGITDPNLTPLIDVSLVLVVILMVATPMAFQSGILVKSATTTGRAAAVATREDRIEVTVLADGGVRVDRNVVSLDALDATLGPVLAASATRRVVVRCDDAVPHGRLVHVLDEARALGATQIAIVGS